MSFRALEIASRLSAVDLDGVTRCVCGACCASGTVSMPLELGVVESEAKFNWVRDGKADAALVSVAVG